MGNRFRRDLLLNGSTLLLEISSRSYWSFFRIWTIPASPCYNPTSGDAINWLQEYSSNFRHSHCPPKSPDVSIIVNIWKSIHHGVQETSPPMRTHADMWTTLQNSS